ncbi:hypothetical protein COU62_00920 [Candidatus Pacearchaeota archaeon CG10_big_fil_rev_8_21_14_0_10_35_219]|nr:thioredoxin domain-containing protein [Candidatus Pacearchaeota archaeon]OIO43001.1 MAG: hypothetical protein AUJ63_01090 [Candidatus Pacearchaeota archaeon CG1_02_35_32]PIO08127.1 MAG: hypothetical protein COU62_00920 [Candidatus Pacearchaeota archaeon CG10_big_fil_rev_8_21_14_0_10_35_219]PIY81061.1 MAG: hypothetical protein COY79_04630 [Candidatus Pacearchaeota archaeon CG_4_10_14_0_8_um_filter_35_169]PIZ79933.1 MAG: hypothetical protein COY00_02940 [Candidatus Pacearchaeota archaeon CG_4_
MVLCIIALPVFAILGLFSVKYRQLASESLDCMFRTVTFRRCQLGLDDRIKSDLTGKLMKRSPALARFFYNYYKLISWIVLVLFIWSAYATGVGLYNYYLYGNCNGPDSDGFCLLNPTGSNSGTSKIIGSIHGEVILPVVEEDDYIFGNPEAELTIIEFGCYRCPYTKQAESIVDEVLEYYNGRVNLQFKSILLEHELSYESALAANCALEQGKYEEYHDRLFEEQEMLNYLDFVRIANDIDLDSEQFNECLESERYEDEIRADHQAGIDAGIQGTPTFFIGDEVIVGPKPFKTFKTVIDRQL